jgi:hypothetical protein
MATIVRFGVAHIGEVHMTGRRCRPPGRLESLTFLDDRLEIQTIGICGQDSSACDIEEEETADRGLAA